MRSPLPWLGEASRPDDRSIRTSSTEASIAGSGAAGIRGMGLVRAAAAAPMADSSQLCVGPCAVAVANRRSQFEVGLACRRGVGVRRLVGLGGRGRIRLRLVGGNRLRHDFLGRQQRMREAGRGDFAGGDDDPRAHLGPAPHLRGKGQRHADAAMRRRIARQHAGVHRDTRPGDPLHERHRRAAIDVGVVKLVLLDDAENAHRRRMALHAGRHRAFRDRNRWRRRP